MKVEDVVTNLIKDVIEENNYILDSVEYVFEDGNNFLRVVIDKNGIIDINDCVTVTHIVDPMLDDIDYITDSYILDVCSKEKGVD